MIQVRHAVSGSAIRRKKLNAHYQLLQQEYPFRSRSVTIEGMSYHYVDEGQGSVLLMVHGNPTWSFAFRHLIQALSSQYRVLAVDHIGCGLSDKPSNYPYQLSQHIDNLKYFVDSLHLENITLVAHDWGGAIGMGVAVQRPEKFARFIFMNTAAFRSQRIPFRISLCRIPVLGKIAIQGFNLFSRAALWMAVSQRSSLTKAAKTGYLFPYSSWSTRRAVFEFVQDIPLQENHQSYSTLKNIEEGLSQFQSAPMLLCWGKQDWCFTLDFLKEFQSRFLQASTVTFPQAGHYLFEDAKEELLQEIQIFLANTDKDFNSTATT